MDQEDNHVAKAPQDQRSSIKLILFQDFFKSWPNLKDTKLEEAERKIKEEMPDAEVRVIPFRTPGKFRHDCELRSDRVWLFVDDSGIVRKEPYTR